MNAETGLVPAVFREWGSYQNNKFSNEPFWVAKSPFTVYKYQRQSPTLKNYIPNAGYEMGVFFHHIVHNYDRLDKFTIFVQADVPLDFVLSTVCFNEQALFVPLRSLHHEPWFESRCSWWDKKLYEKNVWECFHKYLKIFNLDTKLHPPCPKFYAKNNFVVSKKLIQRFPLSTWKHAYNLIMNQTCSTNLDTRFDKHVSGSTEFTSNLIFGNESLFLRPYEAKTWKRKYNWECLSNCVTASLWPMFQFSCVPYQYISSSPNLKWRIKAESRPHCWSNIHEGLAIC